MTTQPLQSHTPLPGSLIERVHFFAENNPASDALVSSSRHYSYADLAEAVSNQVAIFRDSGISQASVVGIECNDDIEHLVLCLAAIHIGATSCTIATFDSQEAQLATRARCNVTHLATEQMTAPSTTDCARSIAQVKPANVHEPSSSARLLFSTSGTTGEPKMVVHYDCDLVAQAHRHISSSQERFACVTSIEHNFVKRHRLYALAEGAANIFIDPQGDSLVNQCLSLGANVLHVSAFQAQDLLALPGINRLADIRLKLGGSHVPLQLRQQLRENITHSLQAGYGTTETGAIGFTDPDDAESGESVGRPLPGIDIRVVNPEREPLGPNEHGEIAIRCAGMFREYLGKPELSAKRLKDGWFYTGDIGYLDKERRIHLSGRSDDMFTFNSMNIYPQDLESTILQHPHVAEVAVIPKASPVHGNIPVALVVFKPDVKPRITDVQKFVRQRAGERHPRQYIIVSEIPKTKSGKISRGKAQAVPRENTEIRGSIFNMLSERATAPLKPSLIKAFLQGDQDILMKYLDMDSLERMNFLVALELEHDVIITPQELRRFRYLGAIVAHVLASPQPDSEVEELPRTPTSKTSHAQTLSGVGCLFQRVFRYCDTVAHLNKALSTFESRLTPTDLEYLSNSHRGNLLIPADAPRKFHVALSTWLKQMQTGMLRSGKEIPEPFSRRRLAPTVSHFSAGGSNENKTLLICFPPRNISQMGIANAIFLQHIDASRFDVLMVSTQFTTGYRLGRSEFNRNLEHFRKWLSQQESLHGYRGMRALGFSAGGRTSIALGYLLGAEMGVCVSGRFHRKRYVLQNLDQVIAISRASRIGQCRQMLLSYSPDNPRDERFARVICKVSGGTRAEIEHSGGKLAHLVLQQLLDHGELGDYLNSTILADSDASWL